MSSLRNQRAIIATLFLPNTAVLGDSAPSTPGDTTSSIVPFKGTHTPSASRSNILGKPGPLKSIVEDLKDKSRAVSPAVTPRQEATNPFLGFPGFSVPNAAGGASAAAQSLLDSVTSAIEGGDSQRKHQTTHNNSALPRVQRRTSRSTGTRTKSRSLSNSRQDSYTHTQPWHVESNPHCNGGLKNALDSVHGRLRSKLWVGTLGTNTDKFKESLKRNMEWRMREEHESLPVWIPDAEFASCYDEFCHQVLWPCLHYAIPDAPKTKSFYESASFKQYVAVNQRFADAIVSAYHEGDIIWVNDYHLMLLPAMIRSKLPNATIGFFMHVAFPSSEIFRCLSVRNELLQGVLGADLIGFQTANFARHFRQTVSRILSAEALPKGIQMDDRFVDVGVFPIGIDVRALTEKRRNPEVAEWVKVLKQRYTGMKLIVGRDKLDEVQGVRHKMQAFEAFLDRHPEYQGKVVLIQVALQTTEENEYQGGVADVISHINSRFSTLTYQPVVFLHTQDLTFNQYLALLTVADAFMVTSVREGMALRTHEFVECQEGRHRPLILSEFTGSYSYSGFRSCIAINPWDKRSTANAIFQALTMSDDEALSRWEDLHNHVVTQSAQAFVTTFLLRCLRANLSHQPDSLTVAPLDVNLVLPRYKHSEKRLILIDFEGTLWKRDFNVMRVMAKVTTADISSDAGLGLGGFKGWGIEEDSLNVLKKLSDDPKNEVWLLSGLQVKGVLEVVANELPKVGIVAENGCFIKTRQTRSGESAWMNMVANFNLTWKAPCLEILHYFTERTPNSFIEEREASIVWRFWNGPLDKTSSDRQWARRQAAEAQNHIFDSLGERYGLRIIPGSNSFLVLPNNISRSTAVGAILHPGGPAHVPALRGSSAASPLRASFSSWLVADNTDQSSSLSVDFVLAIGKDEKLMRRLNELDNAETVFTGEAVRVNGVQVGNAIAETEGIGSAGSGTDAKWKVRPEEVVKVLWRFADVEARR
ncbi:glycosyltransferase family 20-domain-containing protein [Cristinia sonorae]|uniref:Glycosyltransferase family 20-domain-containing protein n=1 Tax=Cristinia sonorae TaxID=1940300 RepID=A0A8K0UPM0_9AGAR|nr:glycosyltransferase family 20-domain-containing protein [Cristinia sonorae]